MELLTSRERGSRVSWVSRVVVQVADCTRPSTDSSAEEVGVCFLPSYRALRALPHASERRSLLLPFVSCLRLSPSHVLQTARPGVGRGRRPFLSVRGRPCRLPAAPSAAAPRGPVHCPHGRQPTAHPPAVQILPPWH